MAMTISAAISANRKRPIELTPHSLILSSYHTRSRRIMSLFDKKSKSVVEKRPDGLDRLPTGQYLTKKWPVLSYERTPKQLPPDWKLKISGLVEHPLELSWEEFLALPH